MTIPNAVFKLAIPQLRCSRDPETNRPRLEGIASSTVTDSHGDEITISAQRKMVAAAKGMTVFLNHEYRIPEDVLGTITKASLVATDQVDPKTSKPIYDMRIGVDIAESNSRAVAAWDLMSVGKSKLGISIGAMIPEGGSSYNKTSKGLIIDDIELVEASLVAIPANPRSFVDYAVKALSGRFPEKLDRVSFLAKAATDLAGETVEDHTEDEEDEVTKASADLDLIAEGGDPDPEPPVEEPSEETTVEKTKVSIWETEGDKTIEIDTGRSKPKSDDSHSAQDDAPESAGGSTGAKGSTKSGDGEVSVVTAATSALDNSGSVVKALSAQLRASRLEVAQLRADNEQLTTLARKAIDNAVELVAKVGKLPAGRQTGYAEIKSDVEELSSIYGEDVLAILKKNERGATNAIHG